MNRAQALIAVAARVAPDGKNAPTKGSVRVRLVPAAPLLVVGQACEVTADADTLADAVRVEVTCGRDVVASLDWRGQRLGWSLRVTELPDGSGAAFEGYLARVRDEIEKEVGP